MDNVPMPLEFTDAVDWYNSVVLPFSPEGVPLRVHLDRNESVRTNIMNRRVWEVLPFTEHSVKLIEAVAKVAEREEWFNPYGVLFCEISFGATLPTQVSATDPTVTVPGLPPMRARVPVYVWLFMRMHEQPGLNSYPVVACTAEGAHVQRYVLSPFNQRCARNCIVKLTLDGVLGPLQPRTS